MPIVSLRPPSLRSDRAASHANGSDAVARATRRIARAFPALTSPAIRSSSVRAASATRSAFVRYERRPWVAMSRAVPRGSRHLISRRGS